MRVRSLAVGVTLVLCSLAVATPAQASDFDRYASRHMLRVSDLPPTGLGDLGTKRYLEIPWSESPDIVLCELPGTKVVMTGVTTTAKALFAINEETGAVLSELVSRFPSSSAARKAFAKGSSKVRSCTGTVKGNSTPTSSYSYAYANDRVPDVTVNGVPSFSIDCVRVFSDTETSSRDTVEVYNVYTLVGNVIITTSYSFFNGEKDTDLTPAQLQLVNQVAQKAVQRWTA